MSLTLFQIALGIGTIWAANFFLQKYFSAKFVQRGFGNCPGGSIIWMHPFRTAAIVFGPIFPLNGFMGYYYAKFSLYKKYGSTCLCSVTFWDSIPTFWLSDADAIRIVSTERTIFSKDVEAYAPLDIYGQSIIGAEGADWKRHRAVARSAFNEANNALVWLETLGVIKDWFNEIDTKREQHGKDPTIDLNTDLTKVTLLVISSAGFGRHASWDEDSKEEPPLGHKIAFRPAITSAIGHIFHKVFIPIWLYGFSDRIYLPLLTPMLNETRGSFEALRSHMMDVISSARAWVAAGRATSMDAALLRNLVEANMAEEDDTDHKSLTDGELLSNTFTFLVAGHETSAHTLSFAIALLALYPDVQQKIHEEVTRLWPTKSPSSYKESVPNLEYTSAVFHETLRLFPSVARLAKTVNVDTTLPAKRFSTDSNDMLQDVEDHNVSIKAGSIVVLDVFGLHMNPIHWGKDVADFKPERFIDTDTYRWPRDAFVAFSAGPRSCIGQRFALAESICILANIVQRYEILVPNDLIRKSYAEQKRVLLRWLPGITLTPMQARVRLRRR